MDPFVRKMIGGSFAFLGFMLLLLAILSVVYFHTHPRCTEEVLLEKPSPDGRWRAAVLRRRCGEESPFFVHVNLRAAGSPLRFGFFSGKVNEGGIFVAVQDAPEIIPDLAWISPTELKVTCAACRDLQVKPRWESVSVR